MKFKIVNGTVIDPTQNLDGKIKDIFVENGFITNPSTAESAKYNIVYDVKGMVVMAGGIDIHSHIAGGNVNNARLLSPEIHSNFLENNLKRKIFLPGFNLINGILVLLLNNLNNVSIDKFKLIFEYILKFIP